MTSIIEEALDKARKFVNSKIGVVGSEIATNFLAEVESIANKAVEETKEFFNQFDILPCDYLDISFNDFADDSIELLKKGLDKVSSELEEAFPLNFLQFPTIDIDFNLPDIDPIPILTLSFALEDLELYLELGVTLTVEATYTLPLFRSQSSLGMALPDAYASALVAIDLALTSEAEVQLQSGFHWKVDGSILLDIGKFAQNISGTYFPDGQFEFLPLTASHGSGKITGVLRVELKAGFEIQNHTVDVFDKGLNISAGVEVSIFANVARLDAEIRKDSESSGTDCQLGFEINVGAAAGATLALGEHVWGPVPELSFSMYSATTKSL
ncbi:Ff.00g036360.m01.CDS01 [Fusarium sp. VM40]|nr:Ff.00g036360.m01.CDS01 [Fusarium sp. VM40]